MATNVPMNKEQVEKDLISLQSSFNHIHKYYNLRDKEIARENFTTIINDLKEYLKTVL